MDYVWNREPKENNTYITQHIRTGAKEVEAHNLHCSKYPELNREYDGYVFVYDDGTFWTDLEGKNSSVRIQQIETNDLEEAKATALMLWRMEA